MQGNRIWTEYVACAAQSRPPDAASDLQTGSSGRLRRSAAGNRPLPTAAWQSQRIGNPKCDCPASGRARRGRWRIPLESPGRRAGQRSTRGSAEVRPPERIFGPRAVPPRLADGGDDPPVAGVEAGGRGSEAHGPKGERFGRRKAALPVADHREPVPEPGVAGRDLERPLEGCGRPAVPTGLLGRAGVVEQGGDRGGPSLVPPLPGVGNDPRRRRTAARAKGSGRRSGPRVCGGRIDARGPGAFETGARRTRR